MIVIDSMMIIADRYHHQYLLGDTMIDNTIVKNRRIDLRNDIRPPTEHRHNIHHDHHDHDNNTNHNNNLPV